MLLDFGTLYDKYDMEIKGLIHAGAHLADEAEDYYLRGIKDVWFIEANPHVLPKLEQRLKQYGYPYIHALLTDQDGIDTAFNVTNYDGMSSSIFEFGQLHLNSSPDTVFVDRIRMESSTLDTVVAEQGIVANFLNMDLQGAELLVLQGAPKTIAGLDYIYTEVNKAEVYVGCGLVRDIDALLDEAGFERVETSWTPAKWGDALYVRTGG